MKIEEVKERIKKIKKEEDDCELAHRMEDDLWYEAITTKQR